jgi:hypothetical protein
MRNVCKYRFQLAPLEDKTFESERELVNQILAKRLEYREYLESCHAHV